MAKATRKNITKAKSKTSPREGLAFIDAAYQRKTSPEPNLARELKMRRHTNDVAGPHRAVRCLRRRFIGVLSYRKSTSFG